MSSLQDGSLQKETNPRILNCDTDSPVTTHRHCAVCWGLPCEPCAVRQAKSIHGLFFFLSFFY